MSPRPALVWRGIPLVWLVLALGVPGAGHGGTPPGLHEYTVRTWRQMQGLPQSSITALAQDGRGFLWVGTQKGLARFDGVRFHIFTRDQAPALGDNWITALVAAHTGEVWVGTLGGLSVYQQGTFTSVALPTGRNRIRELAELPGGRILVGTLEGPFVVSGRSAATLEGLDGEPVVASLVTPGRIWLAGRKLLELDDGLRLKRSIALPPKRAGSWIEGLAADGDRVLLGTDHGLLRLDGDRLGPSPWASLASVPVRALCRDRQGALWIATGTELLRVSAASGPEAFEQAGAPRQVRRLLEDREGGVWAGSIGFGLTQLWLGRSVHYGAGPGLKSAATWSVAPGRGGFWLGTMEGVARLRAERVEPVLAASRLPHPQIWSLYDDGETLWIGTRTGLARYDVAGDELLAVPADLMGRAVYDILPQPPHDLLLATAAGLFRYDKETELAAREAALPQDMTFSILIDGARTGYLGTEGGLLQMSPGGVRSIEPVGRHPINTLLRARDGSLLAGSEDGGLFREQDGRWTRFDRSRGLPLDTVYALVPDAGSGVFVIHHQGTYRLALSDLAAAAGDPARKLAPEILLDSSPERGGESAECCAGIGRHAALVHANALWLTSWGGLLRLGLEPANQPVPWPPPVIERVRAGGKWTDEPQGAVLVPAADRDVTVDFTAPVLGQPSAVWFRYRLESRDTEWRVVEPTAARTARYTDLSAGRHRFKVETLASGRDTPLAAAELMFEVKPRFGETPWFYVVVTGGAGLALLAAHRARVHTLKTRQRDLEATVRERTEDLHRANESLKDLTVTDLLTGLRNRRFLGEQISADSAYLERLRATEPAQDLVLGFLMVDIDHFKAINDRLGHAVGDLALVEFADRLRRGVRGGDYVIRWGGEEFLIVARGIKRGDLPALAAQLLRDVRRSTADTVQLTCSIGFAGHPVLPGAGAGSWEEAVRLADTALYEAKNAGRNRWATYRPRGSPAIDATDREERVRLLIEAADLVLGDDGSAA